MLRGAAIGCAPVWLSPFHVKKAGRRFGEKPPLRFSINLLVG